MDREQQFIENLTQLKTTPGDAEKRKAFVRAELAAARLGPAIAVRLWRNAEKDLAYEAFSFLVDAEELAIVPVLEGPAPTTPEATSQTLSLVTDAELELRERIFKRIDTFLDDKRAIPPKPRPFPTEEKEAPRRVCDEAYVAMRRLVHFGEDKFREILDTRAFYSRGEAERDAEIQKARHTKTWQRAVHPEQEVGDDDDDGKDNKGKPKSGRGRGFTPSR